MNHGERPASSLAIALFGPLDVRLQGEPLPTPRTQKTHWLLALLALQAGRAVERAWLAGALWPESTEQQAATNLRVSLWQLRQALGTEARRLEAPAAGKLRLELVGAEADILVFDEAIARGDAPSLERAVAVHRGPLLQGCVEDWVLQEREVREQAYLAALETLAAEALARGEHAIAVHYLRRLVAADPLRDSAHRALMQALAAAGDIAAATQTYRDFRHALHQELNAAPHAETTALYQEIRTRGRECANVGVQAFRRSGVQADERPPTNDHGPPPETPERPNARTPERPNTPPRLPLPLTRLVGREQDVTEIRARLAQGPLVTLTGMGGIGKTRLALRVAEALAEELPDGAWFVDLAPLRDGASDGPVGAEPKLVARTVARVLDVREQRGQPVTMALVEALRDRQLLLVLDNGEHLLDACAALAQTLLEGCRRLQILTTSREPLGLTGEVVWRVEPLSLPGDAPWEVGKEPSSAAVRLFLERAVAAVPGFRVTERNAATVAEVCRRLDGIPLAIELAATRLKALCVEELAARLEDRFHLLTQGSRTAPRRQQTLQATLDWSYDLLSEAERAVLRRLSVFAGGWTLAAAEAVCSDAGGGRRSAEGSPDGTAGSRQQAVGSPEPAAGSRQQAVGRPDGWNTGSGADAPSQLPTANCQLPTDVLDLLTALVEKSWVSYSYNERAGEGRYGLLETLRQYAHERLLEVGEESSMRGSHLAFFVRLAQEAEPGMRGGEQTRWLDRLEREHNNLHAAIDWSLGAGELWRDGLEMTRSLFSYWDLRHRFGGALGYLKHFAERSADLTLDQRTNVLRLAGLACMKQAEFSAARRYMEEGRALRRQQGAVDEDPRQLQALAVLAINEGDYAEAEALLQQSLRIFRESEAAGRADARNARGWTLDVLGGLAYCVGEFASARCYYEHGLALFRDVDDKSGIAAALLGLGRVAMRQGAYAPARALLQESLALYQEVKARTAAIEVLTNLTWLDWHEAADATAHTHLVEALQLCRETGGYSDTVRTLISAGHLARWQGDAARAARLFGAAAALHAVLKEPMMCVERADYENAIAAARDALGEEAFAAAWAAGQKLTRQQAVAMALEEAESTVAVSPGLR